MTRLRLFTLTEGYPVSQQPLTAEQWSIVAQVTSQRREQDSGRVSTPTPMQLHRVDIDAVAQQPSLAVPVISAKHPMWHYASILGLCAMLGAGLGLVAAQHHRLDDVVSRLQSVFDETATATDATAWPDQDVRQ